jgi:hypothetical protein
MRHKACICIYTLEMEMCLDFKKCRVWGVGRYAWCGVWCVVCGVWYYTDVVTRVYVGGSFSTPSLPPGPSTTATTLLSGCAEASKSFVSVVSEASSSLPSLPWAESLRFERLFEGL